MQPTAEWQTGRAAAVPNITVFTKYWPDLRLVPLLPALHLAADSTRLDSTRLDVSMQHSGAPCSADLGGSAELQNLKRSIRTAQN